MTNEEMDLIVKQAAKKAIAETHAAGVRVLTVMIKAFTSFILMDAKNTIQTPINVVATIWVFYFIAIQKQPDGESY